MTKTEKLANAGRGKNSRVNGKWTVFILCFSTLIQV